MQKLKDNPNHFKAFLHAQKAVSASWGFFKTFAYIHKLWELEPKAVRAVPGHEIDEPGVFYFFLYPVEAEDFVNPADVPGDIELEPTCLFVDSHMAHDKQAAARFCGVTIRQLERWMRGDTGTGREPLRHVKLDRKPVFLEYDLWDYMRKYGCGERCKHVTEYIEGQLLPGFELPEKGGN